MLGILFLFLAVAARGGSLELATELMSEGNWTGARREALRELAFHPDDERALLLAATAGLRLAAADHNVDETSALVVLAHLAKEATGREVRLMAGYEVGRARWAQGDPAGAWQAYADVFQQASDRETLLRSGCALFLLRRENELLGTDQPALLSQLATCRNLWSFELRDEVRVGKVEEKSKLSARPGEWIVAFYRSQIGPAIGHRCSLQPSCSTYFLEASRKHGLLGVPLIADRLVREPGVVSSAERPVDVNGSVRYADPLSDHVRSAKESAP